MKFVIHTVLLLISLCSLQSNAQTACNSEPCLNEGTCYNSVQGQTYYCHCPEGYTGVQCEISLPGTCPPDYPCVNGNCRSNIAGTPHCICNFTYTGADCTTPRPACDEETLCNDGICYTSSVDVTSYICACPAGSTGKHCDMQVTTLEDPCEPNPCQNAGNCALNEYYPEGYQCECALHYSGQNCSTDDRLSCTYEGIAYDNREVRGTDCNLCTCYDGTWSCTESTCDGVCEYEDMVFLENDSRQDDCNTCYCLHGEWMCTTKQCFTGNECEIHGSDYIEIFAENEYRWEECNVCYCLSGLWACTTKSCSNRTVITVSFKFDGEFSGIVDIIDPFKSVLHADISTTYGIPQNIIEHVEVSENYGSIDVSFSLIGSQDGAVDADKMVSLLEEPIDNGYYIFSFNGESYQSRPGSFFSNQLWPENPTKTSSGVDSTIVLIILCSVSGIGFLVIILGVYLYIKTANTKRRDTKYGNAKLPNRRTGLDNGDQTRLTRNRTLPSSLHI